MEAHVGPLWPNALTEIMTAPGLAARTASGVTPNRSITPGV